MFYCTVCFHFLYFFSANCDAPDLYFNRWFFSGSVFSGVISIVKYSMKARNCSAVFARYH